MRFVSTPSAADCSPTALMAPTCFGMQLVVGGARESGVRLAFSPHPPSLQATHTTRAGEEELPTRGERQRCGRRKTYGEHRALADGSAVGGGGVLARVQPHGRVCPGWALGACDGG